VVTTSRFARDPLTHAEPLYQRAIEGVIAFIGDQRYQPGCRLPSENDLAAELGISRPTLREALMELQTQGVIERRRGVGTFVADEKPASLRPGIERLRSFRSLSQAAGVGFARSSWSVQEALADEGVASALGIALGEPVVYVRTTATASEIPAATFGTYILHKYVAVESLTVYSSGSLLDFVIETGSPKLHHTNTELSATGASGPVSEWLDVPDGTPVLGLTEVFYDRSGRSVMYSRNHFLTTQVSFNLVRMVD